MSELALLLITTHDFYSSCLIYPVYQYATLSSNGLSVRKVDCKISLHLAAG